MCVPRHRSGEKAMRRRAAAHAALLLHCWRLHGVMSVIRVHLVPHSHTDPGWLNTYDMYYGRDVKPILTAVVRGLEGAPNRTFVWSETCFFARWYAEQSARKRDSVQQLVASGQLEFVGGGWVQHDEALPTVSGMLESMAEGHAWLYETFGIRPSVGWQLDPFGHSAASASLLGRMGVSSLVVNRINYNLKYRWRSARSMEFQWQSAAPCLHWRSLFTHVLHTHYSAPKGLDFENTRTGFDPRVASDKLRAMAHARAEAYRTSELLMLVGDDFRWHRAANLYPTWERIIAETNGRTHGGITVQFSTPGRYFAALATAKESLKVPLPSYGGDLLPYAVNRESFWTGFCAPLPHRT